MFGRNSIIWEKSLHKSIVHGNISKHKTENGKNQKPTKAAISNDLAIQFCPTLHWENTEGACVNRAHWSSEANPSSRHQNNRQLPGCSVQPNLPDTKWPSTMLQITATIACWHTWCSVACSHTCHINTDKIYRHHHRLNFQFTSSRVSWSRRKRPFNWDLTWICVFWGNIPSRDMIRDLKSLPMVSQAISLKTKSLLPHFTVTCTSANNGFRPSQCFHINWLQLTWLGWSDLPGNFTTCFIAVLHSSWILHKSLADLFTYFDEYCSWVPYIIHVSSS